MKAHQGTISSKEVVQRLSTTHYVVQDLVEQRFLKPKSSETGFKHIKEALRFEETEVEEFERRFVPSKWVANWLGTHTRVLNGRLAELDIHPAIITSAGPSSCYFERKAIENVPKDSMLSARSRKNRENAALQQSEIVE